MMKMGNIQVRGPRTRPGGKPANPRVMFDDRSSEIRLAPPPPTRAPSPNTTAMPGKGLKARTPFGYRPTR